MRRARPRLVAGLALGLLCVAASPIAPAAPLSSDACTLVLREHRSGRELLRVMLPSTATPGFAVAFEHSVLGHTVTDRYELRAQASGWRAHLVEERFDGEGYGLPYGPTAPGERMVRGPQGWSLQLDRVVHPLVVRPLDAQATRLQAGGREYLLAALTGHAIDMQPAGCQPSRR